MRHNIEFVGRLRGKTLSELATGEPVKLASRMIPEWRAKQQRSFTTHDGSEQVTAKYCVGIHDNGGRSRITNHRLRRLSVVEANLPTCDVRLLREFDRCVGR